MSEQIKSRPASAEYCEAWERVFGGSIESADGERVMKRNDYQREYMRRYRARKAIQKSEEQK